MIKDDTLLFESDIIYDESIVKNFLITRGLIWLL